MGVSIHLSAQVTFPVCDVNPTSGLLPEISYRDAVVFLAEPGHTGKVNTSGKQESIPIPRLEAYGHQAYGLVSAHGNHPFVVAAHKAYAQHHPLTLRRPRPFPPAWTHP